MGAAGLLCSACPVLEEELSTVLPMYSASGAFFDCPSGMLCCGVIASLSLALPLSLSLALPLSLSLSLGGVIDASSVGAGVEPRSRIGSLPNTILYSFTSTT